MLLFGDPYFLFVNKTFFRARKHNRNNLSIYWFLNMKDASWLFINNVSRAAIFLCCLFAIGVALLAFNRIPIWQWLSVFHVEHRVPHLIGLSHSIAQTHQPDDSDVVLLIGGSTMRELTPSDAYFSERLSEACKRPIKVINAGTSSQTFLDAWMLSHAVDKEKLKLVVIGLNYFRFNVTKAEVRLDLGNRRFPFNDVGQLNEILDIPLNSFSSLNQLAWLIKNKRHLHLKRAKNLPPELDNFTGPRNRYAPPPMSAEEKAEVGRQFIAQRTKLIEMRISDATLLWWRLAKSLQTRGARVSFARLPTSKTMDRVHALLEPGYLTAVDKLITSGAEFVEIGNSLRIPEEYFYDQAHLLAPGRKLIFPDLVDQVIKRIDNCG